MTPLHAYVVAGALCVLSISGCATAPTGDKQVTLTAERVAQCKAQGGCGLFSQAELLEAISEAFELGVQSVRDSLDGNGCKRGSV